MTRTEVQAKFDAKIAALSIESAIECYTILRQKVGTDPRKAGETLWMTMVMTGEALEKIIGGDLFYEIMVEIDETA